MKKFKRGIFIIISILLFFMIFVSGAIAYSTSDYSIDIPSYYEKVEGGNFSYTIGEIRYINIQKEYLEEPNKYKYNKKGLDAIISRYNYNTYAIRGYKIQLSIVDSNVGRSGKKNYKCFYLRSTSALRDIPLVLDQYLYIFDNEIYILTIGANDTTYLRSTEAKNIIDSFEIYNYNTATIVNVLLPVVGIIVVIIFTIFFILSQRRKNLNIYIN